jgi:uracil-DNA glycosylase
MLCKNPCSLNTGRIVKGQPRKVVGPFSDRVLLIGEAPGREESEQLLPFVGESGRIIDSKLQEHAIDRGWLDITNAVWCRPPGNRTPTTEEIKYCASSHLDLLVDFLKPSRIVTFGAVPFSYVSRSKKKITANSGTAFQTRYGVPGLAMLHPAYIIRFSYDKEIMNRWNADWRVCAHFILHGATVMKPNWHVLRTKADVLAALAQPVKNVVFDFETGGLAFDDRIHGIALNFGGNSYYIPFADPSYVSEAGRELPFWSAKDLSDILAALFQFFERAGRAAAFNAKFDMLRIMRLYEGRLPNCVWDDILLMAHCYRPSRGGRDLDSYIRFFPDLVGYDLRQKAAAKKAGYDAIPLNINGPYSCGDAELESNLAREYTNRLSAFPKKQELYTGIYRRVLPLYAKAQYRGIAVDELYLSALSQEMRPQVDKMREEFTAKYGCSPGQDEKVAQLLFKKMRLKPVRMNKKAASVDAASMSMLKATYRENTEAMTVINDLLEYRAHSHQFNTFVGEAYSNEKKGPTGLYRHICEDGRIRPSPNLSGTVTGRNSYSEPNMQQFPVRDPRWIKLRGSLIPDSDFFWNENDVSQAELRIAAFFSGDPALIRTFRERRDPHANTARIVFKLTGKTDQEIKKCFKKQRDLSKNIIFGAFYGGSAQGLMGFVNARSEDKITLDEATDFFNSLRQEFSVFFSWRARIMMGIEANGKIELPSGHVRYAENTGGNDKGELFNTLIQGTCGYIIKKSVIAAVAEIERRRLPVDFLFDIHDSTLWQTPAEHLEEVQQLVSQSIINAGMTFGVELESEAKVYSVRWGNEWKAGRN